MFKRVFKTIADAFSIDKEVSLSEEEKPGSEPKFKSTIVPTEPQERDVYGNPITKSGGAQQKQSSGRSAAQAPAPAKTPKTKAKPATARAQEPAPPASKPEAKGKSASEQQQEMKTIGSRKKATRKKPRGKKIQQPKAESGGTAPVKSSATAKPPGAAKKSAAPPKPAASASAAKPAPAKKKAAVQEVLIPDNDPYFEEKKREEEIRKLSDSEMREICGLLGGTDKEEIRKTLAKLYRRFNRAASSLDAERRKEAEYMLDIIVEMRQKLVG